MPKLYRHQIDIHLGRRVFHPDRKKIGRLTILVCDEFESNPNWKNKQGGIDIPIGKKVCTIPDHRCFAFGQSTLRDEGILQYPIILLSNEENHICSIVNQKT